MKGKKLAQLALMGLAGIGVSCSGGADKKSSAVHQGGMISEEDLLKQLDDAGREIYYSLDADGKQVARKLASATCAGSNECKGMNACASANHSCAGKGECKGTSVCAFKDKNMAVKIAWKKMQEKRVKLDY